MLLQNIGHKTFYFFSVTGQNIPNLTNSSSALGLDKMKVNGHIQGNKDSEGNGKQFSVHVNLHIS